VAVVDTATPAREYEALTSNCGLLDRSERGKLALTGAGAVEFLNGQVTNELAGLHPGEGCYAAFLTHKGKMLGDLRVLAVGEQPGGAVVELLLDTERVALQALFDMIRRFKVGYEVELHKRTLERALLSLIGPTAERVAARAIDGERTPGGTPGGGPPGGGPPGGGTQGDGSTGLPHPEHGHVRASVAGTPVRLIRTHTGIDLLLDAAAAESVTAALRAAGAVQVSERVAEIARVERGTPRYGVDLDERTIPQEAGLNERAVSFTKGCYVGQETVARLHYRGKPNRHLRGLRLSEHAEPGAELRLGERPVGHLGSSVVSPSFGPIGLALVRREAEPGAALAVGESGASAVVSELPFQ
jgi:tRNA-modifying protein YgfZ